MNVFVFICIGVECLWTFCSVLFGFRKCNKVNDPLRIPGIKYHTHIVFTFLKHKHHKTDASFRSSSVSPWRWNLKMSEFRPPATDTPLPLASLRSRGGAYLLGMKCFLWIFKVSLRVIVQVRIYLWQFSYSSQCIYVASDLEMLFSCLIFVERETNRGKKIARERRRSSWTHPPIA